MKHNLKYLATYLPWLLVLLAFDLFTAVLIWLSDVRMFQALILLYLLATVPTDKKRKKKICCL